MAWQLVKEVADGLGKETLRAGGNAISGLASWLGLDKWFDNLIGNAFGNGRFNNYNSDELIAKIVDKAISDNNDKISQIEEFLANTPISLPNSVRDKVNAYRDSLKKELSQRKMNSTLADSQVNIARSYASGISGKAGDYWEDEKREKQAIEAANKAVNLLKGETNV